MFRTVSAGYAERIAQRMYHESHALASDWLARLDSLLPVDVSAIFPTSQLLDHVPLLVRHIADYLRAPADHEIAANTQVIEKAQELGALRHDQRASVHQILREYDILAEILEQFIATESTALEPDLASPLDGLGIMQRLGHAIRTLMQTTVDTFIVEYTATIGEQRDKLESFNRMVTHELRNPLSTLRFATALLVKPEVQGDAEAHTRVSTLIQRNVQRTTELVRSLEQLAFAERPVDAPNQQRVNLTYVASQVARQLGDMAQTRGVELRIAPGLPEIVTEAAQLELVLMNLCSNAIKYCDAQKSTRYVEIVAAAPRMPGRCTICIRDNGIGIPEEKLPFVFTRFFRAHRERDEELGVDGTGLGLAITEEAVRILGGGIEVESNEGIGTAVYVTLPDPGEDDASTSAPENRSLFNG
jgi:signal transduction histidine kinase